MADTTQDRILREIAHAVHNLTLDHRGEVRDWTVDKQYANTGTLSVPKRGEVVAAQRVYFQFNDTYAVFKPAGSADQIAYLPYNDPDKVVAGIAKVAAFLVS